MDHFSPHSLAPRVLILGGFLMRFILILALSLTAFAQQPAATPDDLSGMYSFLQDGEFVQISVQDGRLSGFISRYADGDKAQFLDHFFTDATINGQDLTFKTKVVHGVSYEFKGRVERGAGKARAQEAYYVVRGTLTQYTTDANHKATALSREVAFKSFPEEAQDEPAPKK
jgi:hypothetical protein